VFEDIPTKISSSDIRLSTFAAECVLNPTAVIHALSPLEIIAEVFCSS